jgi:SAM-dependent methyltransferase
VTWLARGAGPGAAWLAARVAWWRAREAALVAAGDVDVEPPGLVLSADEHARARAALPLRVLVDDVEEALLAWFEAALLDLGADVRATDLGRWRSWLDARDRHPLLRRFTLPSELVAALADPTLARDLLFALAAPPSIGSTIGRYGQRLAWLAAHAPAGATLRAWDVGCATGEGTWELCLALARARPGARLEVVGTTPCPLQRLMAERAARPHDPGATAALAALVAQVPRERVLVRFVRHDLLVDPPAGTFDVITCHGLLGEGIDAEDAMARATATLAAALAPGGVLSIADRFRADRSARAAAITGAAARAAGLVATELRGVHRRPT